MGRITHAVFQTGASILNIANLVLPVLPPKQRDVVSAGIGAVQAVVGFYHAIQLARGKHQ